jgi:hypothetical protein
LAEKSAAFGLGMALVLDARAQGGGVPLPGGSDSGSGSSSGSSGDRVRDSGDPAWGGARAGVDLLVGVRLGSVSLSAGPRAAAWVGGASGEGISGTDLGGVANLSLGQVFFDCAVTRTRADGWRDGNVVVIGFGWRARIGAR